MENELSHYAVVQGGKVVNVVTWNGTSLFEPEGDLIKITGLKPEPGVDWDYADGEFVDNRPPARDDE